MARVWRLRQEETSRPAPEEDVPGQHATFGAAALAALALAVSAVGLLTSGTDRVAPLVAFGCGVVAALSSALPIAMAVDRRRRAQTEAVAGAARLEAFADELHRHPEGVPSLSDVGDMIMRGERSLRIAVAAHADAEAARLAEAISRLRAEVVRR